ncbi:MAG: hypothetical protein PHR45_00080 [Muribaculaceae bacterium]|nr:hypothetical protein [Muribaculaceae bacterium]
MKGIFKYCILVTIAFALMLSISTSTSGEEKKACNSNNAQVEQVSDTQKIELSIEIARDNSNLLLTPTFNITVPANVIGAKIRTMPFSAPTKPIISSDIPNKIDTNRCYISYIFNCVDDYYIISLRRIII